MFPQSISIDDKIISPQLNYAKIKHSLSRIKEHLKIEDNFNHLTQSIENMESFIY